MKMTKLNSNRLAMLFGLFSIILFTACDSDDDGDVDPGDGNAKTMGTANVAVTDAAIDAENVSNVYLNVTGLKFDGEDDENDTIITFESSHEFDLMAYQNGESFDLESVEVNAGSYKSLTLILDEDEGAYVQYTNDTQAQIDIEGDADNEYVVTGDFEIEEDTQTDVVIDIDLRKTLEESSEGVYVLQSSARLVEVESTGSITGSVDNYTELSAFMDGLNQKFKLVAFAYHEGEFSAEDGIEGNLEHTVNTAVVSEDGTFTLAYMNDTEYDVVFGIYQKDADAAADVAFEFANFTESRLDGETAFDMILDAISVDASAETEVSITLGLDG